MEENILQKLVSDKFKKLESDLEDYLYGKLLTNVSILIIPLKLQLHTIFETKNLEYFINIIKSDKKSAEIMKEYRKDLKEEKLKDLGLN